MTITLDLPDELVKNADVYAQTKRLSLAEIIERQLRGLLLEYPK